MRIDLRGWKTVPHTLAAICVLLLLPLLACGQSQSGSINNSLTVNPAATLGLSTGLDNGVVSIAYTQALSINGGVAPFTCATSAGTLPAGVTLAASGATCAFSGTPTAVAEYTFTVKVTDSESTPQVTTQSFTVNVAALLSIVTLTLPNAQVGVAYSAPIATVTGGTGSYTFSITTGTLPAGLTLHPSTGVISGTPTAAAGPVALGFKVVDSGVGPIG